MKVSFYHIGSKSSEIADTYTSYFEKQIKTFIPFQTIKIKKNKNLKESFLKKIKPNDMLVLFDEKGLRLNSLEFSKKIQLWLDQYSQLIFIIGQAEGLTNELKSKSNCNIRLSDMTLNHTLARVVALEQIYRSFSIINNHPYHN